MDPSYRPLLPRVRVRIFHSYPGDFLRYYNGGVLVDLTPYMEDAAKRTFFQT